MTDGAVEDAHAGTFGDGGAVGEAAAADDAGVPAHPGTGGLAEEAPDSGELDSGARTAADLPTAEGAAPLTATGHPAVDAAMQELARVAAGAPREQITAFQAAHRTLRETLAGIDGG